MKHSFCLIIMSLDLAACSHNPPKSYGKFFPINNGQETIYSVPNSLIFQKTDQPHIRHNPMCCPDLEGVTRHSK